MDFTVNNIRIDRANDIGLNSEDLILLSWFVQFSNGTKIERKYIKKENDMGYWVNYKTLIKELPIIFSGKTEKGNKEKLRRMLNGNLSKVLTRKQYSNKSENGKGGSKVYIVLNRFMYESLLTPSIELQPTTENEILINALGILIDNNIKKQLLYMETNLLESAISIAKDKNKEKNYKYIKGIYKNLLENKKDSSAPTDKSDTQIKSESFNSNNIIAQKINYNTYKNKFRNFTETFDKYSEDELENIIEKGQLAKYR
ncbi:MAG: hypothetical protein ACRCW0_06855 [Clostridium sp.]